MTYENFEVTQTISVTIGAGGSGGTSGGGDPGGMSSFGVHAEALGGEGGHGNGDAY